MASAIRSALPTHLKPNAGNEDQEAVFERRHGKTRSHMLFDTEMDNFFALFRRYLNDKAKGNAVNWDRIAPPAQGQHGQLQMSAARFGDAPLIKLGGDFKKVSDFQKRIPSIPKVLELDHLTITGAVNLGRGVTLKGTVIIVATEGSTIDIPPGSILENVVVQGSLRLLEH
ncbi:hypothetical protein ACJZ2D_003147 [Fusarium nematophilum]